MSFNTFNNERTTPNQHVAEYRKIYVHIVAILGIERQFSVVGLKLFNPRDKLWKGVSGGFIATL